MVSVCSVCPLSRIINFLNLRQSDRATKPCSKKIGLSGKLKNNPYMNTQPHGINNNIIYWYLC